MQIEVRGNEVALEEALEFANEKRNIALIQLANYQQSLSRQRQGQFECKRV